jgi:hypothetical protein
MAAVSFTTAGTPVHMWPAQVRPSEITLHLRSSTSSLVSPFSRSAQTLELPGALFDLSAGFPPVKSDVANIMRAFFASLRGAAGRFYFPVYTCRYAPAEMFAPERVTIIPLTADNDTVTCDRTDITCDATTIQMETTFAVSTCPDAETINGFLLINSNRYPLKVGGYLDWDDPSGARHTHIVTSLETTNAATGATTLKVEPPMRWLPLPVTPIRVHSPSVLVRLADDGQGAINQAARLSSFGVQAVQWFPLNLTVVEP